MEKISVILVDGNEDFRGLLQEYMERDGAFTVLASVGDGMEALRAVRRLQPDLVVMDVVLPGLDVFGLLSEITQEPRAPHVLILSAWMQEENQYEALRRGADCFLPKPCDFASLMQNLRSMVKHISLASVEKQLDQEEFVLKTLRDIGIPLRRLDMVAQMILIGLNDPSAVHALQEKIYRPCMDEQEKDTDGIEHRLSYAIGEAWAKGDTALQETIFGKAGRYRNKSGRPSNGNFLVGMVTYCKLELNRRRRQRNSSD